MKTKKNIGLIGPIASGKSTLGKQLSHLLNQRFYDLDDEIENHTGMRIPSVFELKGECYFRECEAKILKSLSQLENIILSTGGGCILLPANRHCLSQSCLVVYLQVSPSIQVDRIKCAPIVERPLFVKYGETEQWEALHLERASLYESIADLLYLTDDWSVEGLAEKIHSDIKAFVSNS